jgi:hypothetical protein
MSIKQTPATRPVIVRGDACDHTEHASASTGFVGRFFPDWKVGGAGQWEPCPNEPSYGAVARFEAQIAGYPDWMNVTSWNPAKDGK